MLVFIFFTSMYGLAHLYFFFNLASIQPFGNAIDAAAGIIVIILALSPIFVHLLSFRLNEVTLRRIAFLSYTWAAFIIIFFPAAVVLEAYNFMAASATAGSMTGLPVLTRINLLTISVFLSSVLVAYGYYEARRLVVEHVRIETGRLPSGLSRFRIVQISDLHIGITTRPQEISSLTGKVMAAAPDLIVSTGDLVEGAVRNIDRYAGMLSAMKADFGMIAVLGNHEYYGGIRHSTRFIEESGFRLLRGETVALGDVMNVVGVNDIISKDRSDRDDNILSESELLDSVGEEMFTLLLKHRANVDPESCGRFDLQLSGHTHKGQMFPVSLATMWLFTHHSGLLRLPEGSALYVSRGAGTAGPPVRLFSVPEITIIDLVRKEHYGEREGGGYGKKYQQGDPVAC